MKNPNKIKTPADEKIFQAMSIILITFFALCCVLPFYLIILGSFTEQRWIVSKGYNFFVPFDHLSFEGYKAIFMNAKAVFSAYGVTFFVTVVGTLLSILITTMCGYVLSRPSFPWRNGFSFFFFFTTLFSGGLVPWYLLCTKVLNFTNHLYALIVPGLFSVWNMIVTKSFMKGIPVEISECAKIDGASEFQIYLKIMLPLSKPLIATLSLFTALGYWNDWYNCMLFISDNTKWNLQYTLQDILNSSAALTKIASMTGVQAASLPSETMKMAMCIVAIGPIILLYPFLQKYFVKGLTIGAVKG